MRVAILHLDLSGGPEERNLSLLQRAIVQAGDAGADWVLTPETAVQGYFFTQKDRPYQVLVQPAPMLDSIRQIAAQKGLTVFLGCAEQDAADGKNYNSCLVIDPSGEVIGRHQKVRSHGSGAEGWASKGSGFSPIFCREMTAGILVCADAYFDEYARELRAKRAEVIIVPAAWPPGGCGGPPENAWKRCSRASGLPVWICNQTGNSERMDMSQAQSAVVIDGEMRMAYSGLQQAVLLFDWDVSRQCLLSEEFAVIEV